ncbi:S-adenosyl-L-methionine-dependent methyltransferase [Xylogone sp. PMI_703]|nr:S-adenosyl-L-methionine-dependent methyltransferase [Xylogone sp. PMI_703]
MADTTTKDHSGNFFRAADYNESYWDDYMAARAKYSSEFYDQVIAYHKEHNQSSTKGVAHDVGTGPGQVATELSKYFDSVVGSDTNETHLAIADTRLEKAGAKGKITWEHSGAEELASRYPAGSASMVTAAECLPLLNVPRAMDTFAHLLRPDGTLAIWFYGRPAFSEPEYNKTCQPLLNDILDLTFEKLIKGGNAVHKAAWKSSTDTLESFLDNVVVSSEIWRDIYRYKWNPHLPMPVVGSNACDYPIEPSSAIDEKNEKVIKINDPNFWAESWDVQEVRRFVECLIPSFETLKAAGAYEHIEPKYRELEQAMGGKDAKRSLTWPVVLILATRK